MVRRLVATLFLAGLLGGCHSGVLGSLSRVVEIGVGTLGPLPADKIPLVRLSAAEAQATALAHERETGGPTSTSPGKAAAACCWLGTSVVR